MGLGTGEGESEGLKESLTFRCAAEIRKPTYKGEKGKATCNET